MERHAAVSVVTTGMAVEEAQAVKRQALEDEREHQRELTRVLRRADHGLWMAFGGDTQEYKNARRCMYGGLFVVYAADMRVGQDVYVHKQDIYYGAAYNACAWPRAPPPTIAGQAHVVKTVRGSNSCTADLQGTDEHGRGMLLHMEKQFGDFWICKEEFQQ